MPVMTTQLPAPKQCWNSLNVAVKPVVKAKDAVARTQEIIVHHYVNVIMMIVKTRSDCQLKMKTSPSLKKLMNYKQL